MGLLINSLRVWYNYINCLMIVPSKIDYQVEVNLHYLLVCHRALLLDLSCQFDYH